MGQSPESEFQMRLKHTRNSRTQLYCYRPHPKDGGKYCFDTRLSVYLSVYLSTGGTFLPADKAGKYLPSNRWGRRVTYLSADGGGGGGLPTLARVGTLSPPPAKLGIPKIG